MLKVKYLVILMLLSFNVNAAQGFYGKETSEITCADINKLSQKELKMVVMGVMLGTTAEGVSVSAFSRFGLENKEDQAYVKGVAYTAFTSISPKLVMSELKNKCNNKKNMNIQAIEVLMELIQKSVMANQ